MPAVGCRSPPARLSVLLGSGLGAGAALAALALRTAGAGGLGGGLGGNLLAAAGARRSRAGRAGAGGGLLGLVHGDSPGWLDDGCRRWHDFRRDGPSSTGVCDEWSWCVPDWSRNTTEWSKACPWRSTSFSWCLCGYQTGSFAAPKSGGGCRFRVESRPSQRSPYRAQALRTAVRRLFVGLTTRSRRRALPRRRAAWRSSRSRGSRIMRR